MRLELDSGLHEIEIRSSRREVRFHSEELARRYLRQFLEHAGNRVKVRNALAEQGVNLPLHHVGDDQVLHYLARKVTQGELRIYPKRLIDWMPLDAEPASTPLEDEQAAKTETPEPAPAEPAPAPAPEEDPLLDDVDPVAQAEALESTAEEGAPLCET